MSFVRLKLAKSILGVSGSVVCIHCKARIDGLFQAEARGEDHQGIRGQKGVARKIIGTSESGRVIPNRYTSLVLR